jgi:hypothetical protein
MGTAQPVQGDPGGTGQSESPVSVGAGLTVDLPAVPLGARCCTVQCIVGSSLTNVLIREKNGTAGSGRLLLYLGSTFYGGADGALVQLEAENIAGPDCQINVSFEGD